MTKFSLKDPVHFLALGFGSGLLKPAPGTWGTLAAVPLYLIFVHLNPIGALGELAMAILLFGVGVYLCGKAASDVGVHDHPAIVWDEIAGFFITMIAVPPGWFYLLLGFVLFRLFDILKPWPIKAIDRSVHGGLGIMLDDVLAGIMACLTIHLYLLL